MTLSFIGYFSSGAALERNGLGTAIELLELCGDHLGLYQDSDGRAAKQKDNTE
ncbi:Hypothetical protein Cp106_1642 [Corynebacterium pseudotuberculosis 1/06-A]|nr:Hypothetical protein Cp106_1642 [Corynebacterium pseudotuberculosis 1/06-A]